MKSRIGLVLIGVALAITLYQIFVLGPQLPAEVASHFGVGGVADGWSSRQSFLLLVGLLQFGLAGMNVGLAQLIGAMPPSMINMPNSEYWLAGSRKQDSIQVLKSLLYSLGGLTALLMVYLFDLTIRANFEPEPKLPMSHFGVVLGIYLVALSWLCIKMILRFRKIPDSGDGGGEIGDRGPPLGLK